MTPLVDNIDLVDKLTEDPRTGYHGYWAVDFFRLDEHLGDMTDLRRLREAMGAKDLRLMLDFAPNHSNPSYNEGWGMLLRDGAEVVASHRRDGERLEAEQYYHHYGGADGREYDRFPERVVKDTAGLSDFRLGEPHVDQYLLDAARWWMECGADAYRIDSLKHIHPDFARRFADAMVGRARTLGKEEMYIVGEWYGGGLYDAASMDFVNHTQDFELLDFGLHHELQGVLADKRSMYDLNSYLERRAVAFRGREDWQVNFLDNHDTERIGTHLLRSQGDGSSDTEIVKRRMDMGMALIMTLPGIPCIYYGTEQYAASTDEGTPNRLMMPGFDRDKRIFRIIRRLADLRRSSPAVQRGTYGQRWLNDDILMFERRHGEDIVLVAVNRGGRTSIGVCNLEPGSYCNVLEDDVTTDVRTGEHQFTLDANTILVLRRQQE